MSLAILLWPKSLGYALSASLNWKIGKLDCSAGANAYGSDSQAATFERFTRDHQYYYFRVRRRF